MLILWDEPKHQGGYSMNTKPARPFREVFPDLAANMDRNGVEVVGDPRVGGIPVAISADIVARFKEQGGEDWELLINLALRKAAGF